MGEATPAALLQKRSQHCRGETAIEYALVPLPRLWRKMLFAAHSYTSLGRAAESGKMEMGTSGVECLEAVEQIASLFAS